ncbi:hypothetical protein ACWATR_10535 [Nostoc sp. UIC 10890]
MNHPQKRKIIPAVSYAYALRKIMMATNKASRSKEALADTRVYQKQWKKYDRTSSTVKTTIW